MKSDEHEVGLTIGSDFLLISELLIKIQANYV